MEVGASTGASEAVNVNPVVHTGLGVLSFDMTVDDGADVQLAHDSKIAALMKQKAQILAMMGGAAGLKKMKAKTKKAAAKPAVEKPAAAATAPGDRPPRPSHGTSLRGRGGA